MSTLISVRPLKLLVVDDNTDAADSLACCMRGFGHRVIATYDGSEAIEQLRDSHFDAVLCDIGLPGHSGYDVASEVRCLGDRDTLVVAITGYGSESVKEAAWEAGFDYWFVKPAEPDKIERILEGHFRAVS
jgi:CheY-like chemotaxis protein